MVAKKLSVIEKDKIKQVLSDPVRWAHKFLITFNPRTKKKEPWTARWYQVNMLRDKSIRKVYRCGRRIGKTETMIVDILHMAYTNEKFVILIVCPYENQVSKIFIRIRELINDSPKLKGSVIHSTKSPHSIELDNGVRIIGFTTGTDAASIRGQQADWIFIDELDYMDSNCFDVVSSIAIERPEIGITCSSTPSGARSHFWKMCTIKEMGYSQHYHPSMHNPNWDKRMEAELKSQLTEIGYVHEVLAKFGNQLKGVFPKDKLDEALTFYNYAYNPLALEQQELINAGTKEMPEMFDKYTVENPAPYNPFRCMGVNNESKIG